MTWKEQIRQGKEIKKAAELPKVPFRSYTLDEDKLDKNHIVLAIKLNKKEQAQLEEHKKLLEQPKSSTAVKQLWTIGAKVCFAEKTAVIINTVKGNMRKNKRIGIVDFE